MIWIHEHIPIQETQIQQTLRSPSPSLALTHFRAHV